MGKRHRVVRCRASKLESPRQGLQRSGCDGRHIYLEERTDVRTRSGGLQHIPMVSLQRSPPLPPGQSSAEGTYPSRSPKSGWCHFKCDDSIQQGHDAG